MKKYLCFTLLLWLASCSTDQGEPLLLDDDTSPEILSYVLIQETAIYPEPSLDPQRSILQEAGTSVTPLQSQDNWVQVRNNDVLGWIYQTQLGQVVKIQERYGLIPRSSVALSMAPARDSGSAGILAVGEALTLSGIFTDEESIWYYGETISGKSGFILEEDILLLEKEFYQDYRDALAYGNIEGLYALYGDSEEISRISAMCSEEPYQVIASWKLPNAIATVAFSPQGDRFLLLSSPNRLYLYNTYPQEFLESWEHSSPITRIIFSPDGPLFKDLNRWEDKLYAWYNYPRDPWNEVTEIAYAADHILLGNSDTYLRIYDRELGRVSHEWKQDSRISAASFSLDGRFVISGNTGGNVFLYDLESGEETQKLELQKPIRKVGLTADNQFMLTWTYSGITLSDVTNNQTIQEWKERVWFRDVLFSADGRYITGIGGNEGNSVYLYDSQNPTESRLWEYGSSVAFVSFLEESLAVGTAARIDFYDPESGALLHSIENEGEILDIDFSPDERYMLTGSTDTLARLYVKPPFCF